MNASTYTIVRGYAKQEPPVSPVPPPKRKDRTLPTPRFSPRLMLSTMLYSARPVVEYFAPTSSPVEDPETVPWRSICLLKMTYDRRPDVQAVGTGFLVSSNVIITAAHNVINMYGTASQVVVSPGKTNGRPLVLRDRSGQEWELTLATSSFETAPGWPAQIQTEDEMDQTDPSVDFAALFLDDNLFEPLGPFFEYCLMNDAQFDAHNQEGKGWLLVGYPHNQGSVLMKRSGRELCRTPAALRYDMYADKGDSGGPVFAFRNRRNAAGEVMEGGLFVAVHTDGARPDTCNRVTSTGRRVTDDIARAVEGWIARGQARLGVS